MATIKTASGKSSSGTTGKSGSSSTKNSGSRGSGKRGPSRGVLNSLTAWLTRPLASFHLLLAVFGLLTVFGLVMVLSASSVNSYNEAGSSYSMFGKQVLYCVVGLVLFYVAVRTPTRVLRRFSLPLFVVCLALLALVLTPLGQNVNGAQSWFNVAGVSFQPVEFAKIAFALWGAHVLVTKRALIGQYRHLLVPVVPAALVMFTLVVMQPDFGSTVTLFLVLIGLLWFAGAPLRLFLMAILGGATGAVALTMMADYRAARISSFLDPSADPGGNGYQSMQGLFALADGGFVGRGLGQGWSKWQYLPYAHNDFIFAVIGQELGFIGCFVVIALFATAGYVGMRIAMRNTDPWVRLVTATLTVWMVGQAAINIGYVVGMLPVTGIPLPLISSGGSAVVTSMVVFGLLANFARHEPEAIAALRSLGPGRVGRLLRLPTPEPYQPPSRRKSARSTNSSSARPTTRGTGTTSTRPASGQRRPRNPGTRGQKRGGHR